MHTDWNDLLADGLHGRSRRGRHKRSGGNRSVRGRCRQLSGNDFNACVSAIQERTALVTRQIGQPIWQNVVVIALADRTNVLDAVG